MSITAPSSSSLASSVDWSTLLASWESLRADDPRVRQRNAAVTLGVSEAELLSTRVGPEVVRLQGPWHRLIEGLPSVGRVMALTRNEPCVIEKTGTYTDVQVGPRMGVVLDPAIDLRLFFDHWHHGFAVLDDDGRGGVRRSLQFYDSDGVAVHKVYANAETDLEAWAQLIARFRHPEQVPGITVHPAQTPPETVSDGEVDVEAFQQEWRDLQDTHHFFGLMRRHKVERLQAFRLAPEGFADRLDNDALRKTLYHAASTELSIMVFVGSPGCIEIHTGPIRKVVPMGPWLNVLDPTFNLHLREDAIVETWRVRKPTADGVVTSIEVYDDKGREIAMLFGERKPGNPELDAWRAWADGVEGAPCGE